MRLRAETWWVVFVGSLGVAHFGAFLWLASNTESPPVPVALALLASTVVLLVGPWAYLAVRRFDVDDERSAGRIVRRVLVAVAALAGAGVALGLTLGTGEDSEVLPVLMVSILGAGVLALVGLVVGPWLFLLTRTVTRERAARVRAEERAELANHLHDSVLQTLTLIQKRAGADGDHGEVTRLARSSERELRRWLYGAPGPGGDGADAGEGGGHRENADLAAALAQAVADVEDRFGVVVELITVGTCPLDARSRALVGAATEALTNAAKHAGVTRVSVFSEVSDSEARVTVRDRGRGFVPAAVGSGAGGRGRGLTESIVGRMQHHEGTATIRSEPGVGTVVELRVAVPLARAR